MNLGQIASAWPASNRLVLALVPCVLESISIASGWQISLETFMMWAWVMYILGYTWIPWNTWIVVKFCMPLLNSVFQLLVLHAMRSDELLCMRYLPEVKRFPALEWDLPECTLSRPGPTGGVSSSTAHVTQSHIPKTQHKCSYRIRVPNKNQGRTKYSYSSMNRNK